MADQPSLSSTYDESHITPAIGMYAEPYAKVWPDLAVSLKAIYKDKVADVRWLPPGWWATVDALMPGNEGAVLVPTSSFDPLAPAFLNTAEKKAWWDEFHTYASDAVRQYAAGQQAAGAAALNTAYDKAAFWNRAYLIADGLQTPVKFGIAAVSAAGQAAEAAASVVSKFNPAVLAGIVGVVGAVLLVLKLKRRR